jgi:DNA polymerase-3 subunit delta
VKLSLRQLRSHLDSGIAPLYLVSGDEPLLVDEVLDGVRAAARRGGCDERAVHIAERGFDWQDFQASLQNLSLFASRQLIELRLPTGKPGDAGARQLAALAAAPLQDKVVVVITPALNTAAQKTKWARSLIDSAVWIPLRAPGRDEWPAWLSRRLANAKLSCDPEALELLAARVEGNLLAAKQEVDKLVLLAEGGRVTVDTVRAAVADGARYDVFQLADAALAGESARAVRILQHLERDGTAPTLVLWSLAREIGVLADVSQRMAVGDPPGRAMGAAGVWRSRESLVAGAVRRQRNGGAGELIRQASVADRIVKGARRGQPWNALLELTLAVAGAGAPAGETV